MYGMMAFVQFYLFRYLLGAMAQVNSPEFWFTMQIAMIAGFVTKPSGELVADQGRH
jgi:hypothetical protein